MINFLLKYLGVYGLMGVVAVAVIIPTYVVYNRLVDGQPPIEEKSLNKNKQKLQETKQPGPQGEVVSKPETTSSSANQNGTGIKSKTKVDQEQVASSVREDKTKLLIDIFRVDQLGNIITAGKISEKAEIEIVSGNKEILGSSKTEGNGNFVVFGKIQGSGLVQTVKVRGLIKKESKKKIVTTENLFFVIPKVERNNQDIEEKKIEPPTIVRDDGTDLKILAPVKSNFVESITLDTISYRDDSVAVLAGRARAFNIVRVYLDNIFVVEASVDPSGGWTVSLEQVVSGVYTLRLDEINKKGKVQGRLELPFKRENESLVESMSEGSITVQPGNSLWRIARKYYGKGLQYVDIFERNSHLIKDPNLIYPGQIFSLPN